MFEPIFNFNPCEYCPYASKAIDSDGNTYFKCDLDDAPDNYPDAVCCSGDSYDNS